MLTGDKIETAICIAISTGLKAANQQLYCIREIENPD
jgi:phospholipid-translocating ATPase